MAEPSVVEGVRVRMGKNWIYVCNACGDKQRTAGGPCPCGGRYERVSVAATYGRSRGAGQYKNLGITMHKRKTQGFKRS